MAKKGLLHKELGISMKMKIPAKKLADQAKKGGKIGERARVCEKLKRKKK